MGAKGAAALGVGAICLLKDLRGKARGGTGSGFRLGVGGCFWGLGWGVGGAGFCDGAGVVFAGGGSAALAVSDFAVLVGAFVSVFCGAVALARGAARALSISVTSDFTTFCPPAREAVVDFNLVGTTGGLVSVVGATNSNSVTTVRGGGGMRKKKARIKLTKRQIICARYAPDAASGISR